MMLGSKGFDFKKIRLILRPHFITAEIAQLVEQRIRNA
jgi:hypothetical protein